MSDLSNNISQFFLDLLLSPLKPLPEVVTNAASLEKRAQRLLGIPYRDDPIKVLCSSPQKRGFQYTLGYLWAALRLDVKK